MVKPVGDIAEMNLRRAFFTLCVGGLVLSAVPVCQGIVDTTRIDEIVKKPTLSQSDLQVVDEFMSDAVLDIVHAADFADVSKTRATILRYQQANKQPEYVKQYADSVYKQVEKGLASLGDNTESTERAKIGTNLLILADSLKDPRVMDLAITAIAEKAPPVRYWAVRIATDPNLWSKLNQNQASAAQTTTKLLAAFSQVASSSSPEIMALVSGFAGPINSTAADELLTKIADARIKQYSDWTVSYELADATILKQLSDKIVAGSAAKSQLAKRFAQLYSFAVQRYIKTKTLGLQADQSRDYLTTVLIDTEDKCLAKLLSPQTTIRKAVESGDTKALQAEHDKLFGSLPTKFGFTYGGDGQSLQAPIPLLDPASKPTTPAPAPAASK
jgi:hypothetical protein